MPDPDTLGLLFSGFNTPASDSAGTVFGARVATQTFHRALFRHGRSPRYESLASPGLADPVRAEIGAWIRSTGSDPARFEVRETVDWARDAKVDRYLALHDPGSGGLQLFHLRTKGGSLIPVTFVHYTVSYAALLHDWFLPILLADTHPCDTIFCTSDDSRIAVQRLLEHVDIMGCT